MTFLLHKFIEPPWEQDSLHCVDPEAQQLGQDPGKRVVVEVLLVEVEDGGTVEVVEGTVVDGIEVEVTRGSVVVEVPSGPKQHLVPQQP